MSLPYIEKARTHAPVLQRKCVGPIFGKIIVETNFMFVVSAVGCQSVNNLLLGFVFGEKLVVFLSLFVLYPIFLQQVNFALGFSVLSHYDFKSSIYS